MKKYGTMQFMKRKISFTSLIAVHDIHIIPLTQYKLLFLSQQY